MLYEVKMKRLLIIIFLSPLLIFAKGDASWVVEDSLVNPFEHISESTKIGVKLIGEPNGIVTITISLFINNAMTYEYQSEYWENIDSDFAKKVVANVLSNENIKLCSELEPKISDWADVHLLVSDNEYSELKTAGCMIFIHNTSMENWRTVLIPKENIKPFVVNEYGV